MPLKRERKKYPTKNVWGKGDRKEGSTHLWHGTVFHNRFTREDGKKEQSSEHKRVSKEKRSREVPDTDLNKAA